MKRVTKAVIELALFATLSNAAEPFNHVTLAGPLQHQEEKVFTIPNPMDISNYKQREFPAPPYIMTDPLARHWERLGEQVLRSGGATCTDQWEWLYAEQPGGLQRQHYLSRQDDCTHLARRSVEKLVVDSATDYATDALLELGRAIGSRFRPAKETKTRPMTVEDVFADLETEQRQSRTHLGARLGFGPILEARSIGPFSIWNRNSMKAKGMKYSPIVYVDIDMGKKKRLLGEVAYRGLTGGERKIEFSFTFIH